MAVEDWRSETDILREREIFDQGNEVLSERRRVGEALDSEGDGEDVEKI
jgi:hypothetical protein